MSKVTAEMCVLALKTLKHSTTAKALAEFMGTESRNVATALRGPTSDGRVSWTAKNGIARYRFVRLKAKSGGAK